MKNLKRKKNLEQRSLLTIAKKGGSMERQELQLRKEQILKDIESLKENLKTVEMELNNDIPNNLSIGSVIKRKRDNHYFLYGCVDRTRRGFINLTLVGCWGGDTKVFDSDREAVEYYRSNDFEYIGRFEDLFTFNKKLNND